MNTLQQLVILLGLGKEIVGEIVTPDPAAKTYTFKNPMQPGSLKVYYNGLRYSVGVDYTLTVGTNGSNLTSITFLSTDSFASNDVIVADYKTL